MMTTTRILLVEDESIVAIDIGNRLTRLGYEVTAIAATGEEAIDQAQQTNPDLVLMDIKLKGDMDGIEAAAIIRARHDTPVVYLTAYADELTLQRAKITTPHGYLLKPYEERELHTIIEIALYKHRIERRLKESERWLFTTLQSIGEAVIVTDNQAQVIFLNPVGETLTGWSQAEAQSQPISEVLRIEPEPDRKPLDVEVAAVLEKCEPVSFANFRLMTRTGQTIIICPTAAPLKDDKGHCTGVVLTFRDVSEVREAQARLQQQEKMAAMGRLAGGMAHEFNNILTSILGFAELAESSPDNTGVVTSSLAQVIIQSQRAARLMNQVMDFSRKSIIQPRMLELVPFLQETVRLLKHSLPPAIKIVVALEPPPETYAVLADPTQLRQTLANLVTNAKEAMPLGGTLTFKLWFDPPAADGKPWANLAVSDTGAGISPEVQPKVFEPFFTTKKVGQGAGLGLSQAYGIIERYQGSITLQSKTGVGTTALIRLPVETNHEPAPKPSGATKLPEGHGETLLILEDTEYGVLTVMQNSLEFLGYKVLAAASHDEALKIHADHHQDIALVLADMTTPELGGTMLAHILQNQNPDIKVLALIDYLLEAEMKAIFPKKNLAFLRKPWSLEQLAQAVKQLL